MLNFKTFTLQLVDGLFEYIGIKDLADDEQHFNKELRIMATNWACRLGSEDCREKTNSELRSNWENLHANMRPTIYCNGLRADGENDFQSLKNILNKTVDSTERITLLNALGCSENQSNLLEYLQSSIQNIYFTQSENYRVFASVMGNGQVGLDVAIQFLEAHLSEAVTAYGNTNMNNGMIAMASNVVSIEFEQRVSDAQIKSRAEFSIFITF